MRPWRSRARDIRITMPPYPSVRGPRRDRAAAAAAPGRTARVTGGWCPRGRTGCRPPRATCGGGATASSAVQARRAARPRRRDREITSSAPRCSPLSACRRRCDEPGRRYRAGRPLTCRVWSAGRSGRCRSARSRTTTTGCARWPRPTRWTGCCPMTARPPSILAPAPACSPAR